MKFSFSFFCCFQIPSQGELRNDMEFHAIRVLQYVGFQFPCKHGRGKMILCPNKIILFKTCEYFY